ncbi:Hypothetical_protein [Hexamita inflata]|uniref:Hypothetical_protein n=1 Tax=Hexamita inflata TaxID=28002 RepID=A0AA86UM39_9EUKA|nr:Hypothetical protein HINF_LOCUS48449 [Hexamita inflata]
MSVLMRRENTLIIEPGSDISKIQIINFILLPNSKKHFEGPPLYQNLYKTSYRFIQVLQQTVYSHRSKIDQYCTHTAKQQPYLKQKILFYQIEMLICCGHVRKIKRIYQNEMVEIRLESSQNSQLRMSCYYWLMIKISCIKIQILTRQFDHCVRQLNCNMFNHFDYSDILSFVFWNSCNDYKK